MSIPLQVAPNSVAVPKRFQEHSRADGAPGHEDHGEDTENVGQGEEKLLVGADGRPCRRPLGIELSEWRCHEIGLARFSACKNDHRNTDTTASLGDSETESIESRHCLNGTSQGQVRRPSGHSVGPDPEPIEFLEPDRHRVLPRHPAKGTI